MKEKGMGKEGMARIFLVFLGLVFSSGNAISQSYPSKPVKIVIGFAVGGPTDIIGRIIAQDLTQAMGQSFVIENKMGANAIIATEFVAQAPNDGYTLLFSSLSLLVNAILIDSKVKYDPFKDFAPISNAALLPMVIVTSPQTPVNSIPELIAAAKARPGELSYGTSGHGGSTHLAGAMLENVTGISMINVPFKGNGPALVEVMAGRVTFMFYPAVGIAEQVAAKRLKVLAVGTTAPHPDFPGVPTMSDAGLKGFEATAPWVGMLAPAGTPAAIVNRLSEELRKSLAKPDTQLRLKQMGAITVGDTPAEFAAFLKKDYERWAQVIKASGVKAQ
jgi:tripartite-type tricarboxylate transporter receptor subunit TctC